LGLRLVIEVNDLGLMIGAGLVVRLRGVAHADDDALVASRAMDHQVAKGIGVDLFANRAASRRDGGRSQHHCNDGIRKEDIAHRFAPRPASTATSTRLLTFY